MAIWQLAQDKLNAQMQKKLAVAASVSEEIATADGGGIEGSEESGSAREESHILVYGSKNCGKTSLILRFLDRDEPPKPTTALEFTYGRRTKGSSKEVGHIWELGGGPHLLQLLETPISAKTLENLALVIMVDLSEPEHIWSDLDASLKAAKHRIEKAIQELKPAKPDIKEKLLRKAWDRLGSQSADRDLVTPFLVPLAIVGGKYDVFQDLDPEHKKIISKTLRFIAHSNGAILQYFSVKVEGLVTRGRALISHLTFNTSASKGLAVDYSKPVFVPAGADSFQEIGPPIQGQSSLPLSTTIGSPSDLWQNAFCSNFPQKDSKMIIHEDPAKDPQFKEDAIDLLRAQKDLELERYAKQKAREQSMGPIVVQE